MDIQYQRLNLIESRPTADSLGGQKGGVRYLERVEQALEAWFLLYGLQPKLDLFRLLTSSLAELPPVETWRQNSKLCAYGVPIEFCHGLGPRPIGPGFTLDAGPYGVDPMLRLENALKLAQLAAKFLDCDSQLVEDLGDCYEIRHSRMQSLTIWLGMAYGREGLNDTEAIPRLKLYMSNGRRDASIGLDQAMNALASLGCAPRGSANRILDRLKRAGYFRQLALNLEPPARFQAKLYFRLAQVDLTLLRELCTMAGIPDEGFARYVKTILGESADWKDPEAGVGLALDSRGEPGGLVLYHYTRYYFPSDAALRQRVLAASPGFGWDVSGYRAASRLLEDHTPSRRCWLGGYGIARNGADGLRLYNSTYNLSDHDERRDERR